MLYQQGAWQIHPGKSFHKSGPWYVCGPSKPSASSTLREPSNSHEPSSHLLGNVPWAVRIDARFSTLTTYEPPSSNPNARPYWHIWLPLLMQWFVNFSASAEPLPFCFVGSWLFCSGRLQRPPTNHWWCSRTKQVHIFGPEKARRVEPAPQAYEQNKKHGGYRVLTLTCFSIWHHMTILHLLTSFFAVHLSTIRMWFL